MANVDAPFGFRALRNKSGGTTVPTNPYVASGTNAVYDGALMYLTDAATVTMWTGTGTGRLQLIGVSAHQLTASSSSRELLIYDDPAQEFEVQSDDDSLTALTDFLHANLAPITPATGNTTTLQSISEIDGSSATTVNNSTTIRVLRGLRFSGNIGQDTSTSFVNIVVRINDVNHLNGAAVGIL